MNKALLAYIHDLLVAGVSLLVAFVLRLGLGDSLAMSEMLAYIVPVYIIIAAISFRLFGMYRGIWRYASLTDLVTITKAVITSVGIFVIALFWMTRLEGIPRSIPVIHGLVLLFMLGGSRVLYRLVRDKYLTTGTVDGNKIPVLLVGSGDGADLFCRTILNDRRTPYKIIGILDDRGQSVGRSLHGISILGSYTDLSEVVTQLKKKKVHPQRLIFTETTDQEINQQDIIRKLAEPAETMGLTLARLPSLTEFKDGLDDGRVELRPIAIEDLLSRPQVALDLGAIKNLVKDHRVLVTGAGGSIGSELVRQILGFEPSELIMLDHAEYNLYAIDKEVGGLTKNTNTPWQSILCDVRDEDKIIRVFKTHKPELVFHAAALKHVPMVELNPSEGILTNVIGTQNVARAAQKFKSKAFVQISTDKAVNPYNIMGAAKRLAEYYCQALDLKNDKKRIRQNEHRTHFMTVRFGNVLGSSGSVVPLFREQLEKGGPLTVTHPEIKRYFMTIKEAVGLVLQASAHGIEQNTERGQIFVLDMGEPVKIVDIAKQMIRLSNVENSKDIKITFTGLRPGEKLFEELFDKSETPTQTGVDGILSASPRAIDLKVLEQGFENLKSASHKDNEEKIRQLLKKLVPGFVDTTMIEMDKAEHKKTTDMDGNVTDHKTH